MKRLILAVAAAISLSTSFAAPECSPDKFTVVSQRGRADDYGDVFVVAAVRNDNAVACSAKVQVSVLDKTGALAGTTDTWVVTDNYAPGMTRNVSIRIPRDLAKIGKSFKVAPIEARIWSR